MAPAVTESVCPNMHASTYLLLLSLSWLLLDRSVFARRSAECLPTGRVDSANWQGALDVDVLAGPAASQKSMTCMKFGPAI
jgi:hypothetical protein